MLIKKIIVKKAVIWMVVSFCMIGSFFLYFTISLIYKNNINNLIYFAEKQLKQQVVLLNTYLNHANTDNRIKDFDNQINRYNNELFANSAVSIYRVENNKKILLSNSIKKQDFIPINETQFWNNIELNKLKGNFNIENKKGKTIYITWQYLSDLKLAITVNTLLKTDISNICKPLIIITISLFFVLIIIGLWLIVRLMRPVIGKIDVEYEKLNDFKFVNRE